MHEVMPPRPRKHKNRPRTPFTFTRFMVPELAGYHGKAIYLDADMQVFGDIRELADAPFGDHHLLCTTQNETPEAWRLSSWFHPGRQMSVMVLDCEALDWHVDEIVADLDAGRYSYADLLFRMCIVPADKIDGSLPAAWNHLERYEPGVTHLTHYTVGDYQPWRHPDNPLRDLWMGGYRQAVADGAVPPAEVERAISRGHVLPDLAHALSSAPAKPLADQSSAALELEAARFRIIELRNRQIRGRAVSLLKRLYPRVRKARELGPESLVANAVERAAYHFRRVLR